MRAVRGLLFSQCQAIEQVKLAVFPVPVCAVPNYVRAFAK